MATGNERNGNEAVTSGDDEFGRLEPVDETLLARGWVDTEKGGDTPAVEIRVNGRAVAEGHATAPRTEGSGAAFAVAIPPSALTSLSPEVTAIVSGRPLPGSPQRLKLFPPPKLAVARGKRGTVVVTARGWPGDRLEGTLLVDGKAAARLTLETLPDTPQEAVPERVHEARWPLPEHLRDAQLHVLAFEVREGSEVLRADTVVMRHPAYHVHVDEATEGLVRGWAVRADRPTPLTLEVLQEGRCVGKGSAAAPRPDVQRMLDLATDRAGFSIPLSPGARRPAMTLTIRDSETGLDLAEVSVANRHEALAEVAKAWKAQAEGRDDAIGRALLAPLLRDATAGTSLSTRVFPPRRPPASERRVSVVIPVQDGQAETAECLESVLEAETSARVRVIVVNSGTTDPILRDLLESPRLRDSSHVSILHRTRKVGFFECVNLGIFAAGGDDVVLLHPGTSVGDGWIDRLARAAWSAPGIGTVTPLSNDAGFAALPYAERSMPLDDPDLARSVDSAARRVNDGALVDLPVAESFCMYIRRACIDEIGFFQAQPSGGDYATHVDFCLRACAQGWRHVLSADTFAMRHGAVGFGKGALRPSEAGLAGVGERHASFPAQRQRFRAADPVRPARRALNLALIDGTLGTDRVLHVTHGFGGGTERYVVDLAAEQRVEGLVPFVLRVLSDGRATLESEVAGTEFEGFFAPRHVEAFGPDEEEALRAIVERLGFRKVHLHAPFGLSPGMLDWLTGGLEHAVTVHDYAWICPRVTLTLPGARYCGEPEVGACESCVLFNGAHPGLARLLEGGDGSVRTYRERLAGVLRGASSVHVGAQDVADRLRAHGIGEARFRQGPYPGPEAGLPATGRIVPRSARPDGPARIAVLGAVSEIKGLRHLIDCAEHCREKAIDCEFVVLGYTTDPEAAARTGRIHETGRYEEGDLDDLVALFEPDVAFFPNRWPETYSYTLSHAFRLGLWPVVTDIGALAERVRKAGFGTVIPLDADPAETVRHLLTEAWRARARTPGQAVAS